MNDSLKFADGIEAMTSANSTSVARGWKSPFGDFRSPLTWTMAGLFGLSFFLAICGFIATKQAKASKKRRVRTMEKNSNKTPIEETNFGVENRGCDVVVTAVQGPALLVSSTGNSAGKAKSAAGQKSIASASDAHLEEISTMTMGNNVMAPLNAPVNPYGNGMTPVIAAMGPVNAHIRPSTNDIAPIDAPEKTGYKREMALAENTTAVDAPIMPESDKMPPPDYDTVADTVYYV